MSDDLKACNIFDLRDQANRRVPRGVFEFVDPHLRPASRALLRSVPTARAVAEA